MKLWGRKEPVRPSRPANSLARRQIATTSAVRRPVLRKSFSDALRFEDLLAQGLWVQPSKSGQNVTWETALKVTTAVACARVVAESLCQVPLKIFRKTGQVRMPAEDHPLYELLTVGPNDWQTSDEFIEQIVFHSFFTGNAVIWKNVWQGTIRELLAYEPQQLTYKRNGWAIDYLVHTDAGEISLPASEVWHLRGPSWNGWTGLDFVKIAREALGLALAQEEHGAKVFSNGATLGGILSTEQSPNEEQRMALRKSWEARHQGSSNAFKTAVLWGGMKFTAMSSPNKDSQFLESRQFQVEEVCRAARVLPIMVGYSDKTATYASAEQMFLAHIVYTVAPWARRIELGINKYLLTKDERREGLYAKFMLNALMRGAAKDRAEYFAKALGAGGAPAWMTQDEVREYEELNPMGGAAAMLPIATNVGGNMQPGNSEDGDDTQENGDG